MINLQITSDNIEVTPSMKVLAEDKITKITSRLKEVPEDLISVRVVLNKGEADDTFDAKIEVTIKNKKYFANNTAFNLETAIISAVTDVQRQYNKDRSKNESSSWQKSREMKVFKDEE
ncbi:HPF/RaiA family ribosome-associated protein [candidate division WWE3 bacterium]|nr:HPF/RaiA family ribosome-associated protein [candidate division WWE3 bacterium]